MQGILEQNTTIDSIRMPSDAVLGEKIGILASLLGCRHRRLGRPMTLSRESYLPCLECGARKRFDAMSMKTLGGFYYPPKVDL